jgi:hypothetical protein
MNQFWIRKPAAGFVNGKLNFMGNIFKEKAKSRETGP